jgi:hypothetical protein
MKKATWLKFTGLSGEPTVPAANGRPHNQRATRGPCQRSVGHIGLSGVHRTVSGEPTAPAVNGRPRDQRVTRGPCQRSIGHTRLLKRLSGGAADCPVHHSTEGKIGLPSCPPTAPSCLGAMKRTPRRMEHNTKLSRNILRLLDSDSTHLIFCVSDLSSI